MGLRDNAQLPAAMLIRCFRRVATMAALLLAMGFVLVAQADSKDKLPIHVKRLILQEDYPSLLAELKQLSEQGNTEAQYQMGMFYLHGKGVPQSQEQALQWFERAADEQHVQALYNAALLLQTMQPASPKVVQYLQLAAKGGLAIADKKLEAFASVNNSAEALMPKLWQASKQGNEDLFEALIGQGVDLNRADAQGKNALLFAIENKQWRMVDRLLSAGAAVDMPDALGNSPLHYAVQAHDLSVLNKLVKRAPLEPKNRKGQTPLLLAVELNDAAAVNVLLAAGADVNRQNAQRQSAFALAKLKNNPALMALLTHYGANDASQEQQDKLDIRVSNLRSQLLQEQYRGWSELGLASWLGDEALVNWCLVNLPIVQSQFIDAYQLALQAGHQHIAERLINALAKDELSEPQIQSLLTLALDKDALATFKLVFETFAQAERESAFAFGSALLFRAIAQGQARFAAYLLEHKVAPEFSADDGTTCLIMAAKRGMIELVDRLIAAQVKVNQVDRLGRSALWHAVSGGHQAVVQTLLAHHADLEIADHQHVTVLFRAIDQGHAALAKLLVSAGADLTHLTDDGNNVLITAVAKGDRELVAFFLGHKRPGHQIDVEHRNNNSVTALMVAVQNNDAEIVKLLITAGANPRRKSRSGQSAIDLAKTQELKALLERE